MTHANAIKIVLRAAEANANGHSDAREILRAVEMVRELFKLVQRGQMRRDDSGDDLEPNE